MKRNPNTDSKRAAELDAKHAAMYRERKPQTRWMVVWRPLGCIVWLQSHILKDGMTGSLQGMFFKKRNAEERAREVRNTHSELARPYAHKVKNEARVIRVQLPR